MTDSLLIALNGLQAGRNDFFWQIGGEFFKGFGNSDIVGADLKVEASVEKSGTYLGLDCRISGILTVPCDRCLDDLDYPIDELVKLSIKFGEEPVVEEVEFGGDEREILYLPADGSDLDISQVVYDYACLALPIKRVHEEGKCNPAVLRYLTGEDNGSNEDSVKEENNPFAVLKGLMDDNKE